MSRWRFRVVSQSKFCRYSDDQHKYFSSSDTDISPSWSSSVFWSAASGTLYPICFSRWVWGWEETGGSMDYLGTESTFTVRIGSFLIVFGRYRDRWRIYFPICWCILSFFSTRSSWDLFRRLSIQFCPWRHKIVIFISVWLIARDPNCGRWPVVLIQQFYRFEVLRRPSINFGDIIICSSIIITFSSYFIWFFGNFYPLQTKPFYIY